MIIVTGGAGFIGSNMDGKMTVFSLALDFVF